MGIGSKGGGWPYYAPKPLSLAPYDLPPPIGPLTPADDLCGYPSGLEGLGAFAPAQSRYSFHDGLTLRYRGGIGPLRPAPAHSQIRAPRGWISAYAEEFSACLRSFPFRKELARPRMVVPTGAVVCGRADGLRRPIERFRPEWLSGSIDPDAGRGATGERV